MVLSVAATGDGPKLTLSPQPAVESHSSRYCIPRTLPYFANFKSQTISYKQFCDVEGGFRKQRSQRQCFNGNGLQVRGHVVEKKPDTVTKEKENKSVVNGNVKSISVNDLLDQHLSKLTLGGIKSAASSRKGNKAKLSERPNKTENQLDSGSDDSMLIRQVQEIEKGTILRQKLTKRSLQLEIYGPKRAPLEPSIVTLVHTSNAQPALEVDTESLGISMADSPEWSAGQGPNDRPTSAINSEKSQSYTVDQFTYQEALIPDCTTVDSPFVRHQPRSVDSPVRIYQREKLCMQQRQPRPLLCEKVRYSSSPRKRRTISSTPLPANRVAENPSTRCKTPNFPQHSLLKRKKKRPKSKSLADPMKGFGPWVAEPDRNSNLTFVNAVNMAPQIKVDFR